MGLPPFGREFDYEIIRTPQGFGKLRSVSGCGGQSLAGADVPARPCFETLHGRHAPCEDCPAMGDGPWPRIVARRHPEEQKTFVALTAACVEESVARVSVRIIGEGIVDAIHARKLAELAAQARLSERERAILPLLVMGRSTLDIATALDIRPRTVKFHLANLLKKVGADSRADLVRLVL